MSVEIEAPVGHSPAAPDVEVSENDEDLLPAMQHSDTPSVRLPRVLGGHAMIDPNVAFGIIDPQSISEITSKVHAQAQRKCSAKVKKYFDETGAGHGTEPRRPIIPRNATTTGDGRYGYKTVSGDSQPHADASFKHMWGVVRTSDDENDEENAKCGMCKEGNGPFKDYVTLKALSHGCSNCQFTGDSPRCSLNPNRHERQATVAVKVASIEDVRRDLEEMKDELAEIKNGLAEIFKSTKRPDASQGHKRSFSAID